LIPLYLIQICQKLQIDEVDFHCDVGFDVSLWISEAFPSPLWLTAPADLKSSPSLLGHFYGLRDEGKEPHQQCALLLQG